MENKDEKIDSLSKRYRTWDNLQYAFRSIEKFIPWYNNTCLINNNFSKEESIKKYKSKFINLKYGKDLFEKG